jgi:hypothetical protein
MGKSCRADPKLPVSLLDHPADFQGYSLRHGVCLNGLI